MKKFSVVSSIVLSLGLAASVFLRPGVSNDVTPIVVSKASSMSTTELEIATFAGGCFWCVEAAFEKVPGVSEVISGYTGGEENSPNYKQVASGRTGHTEAVEIHYDDTIITYEGLLQTLWRTANPTDIEGQYVDRGRQYRPEIFYHNETQKLAAEQSKRALNESGIYNKPVLIAITPASEFYPAEDYHQDYYKKNPVRYKFYTRNSGRYQFIDSVWPEGRNINYSDYQPASKDEDTVSTPATGMNHMATTDEAVAFNPEHFVKPSNTQLKASLSALEYKVTQKDGTERPFSNPMHAEKRAGLYVDIVSGEPLFSSADKYDSGTGWPSFSKPISPTALVEKEDRSLFSVRTEIRSKLADSHLGHVFNDGPASTGKRYCMNAASMRFIPVEQMADNGYAAYIDLITGGAAL